MSSHGVLLLEPIPALSQGAGRVLPGQVASSSQGPHWWAMWGSVSCSRTLWHAAQPCPEPGFERATFRSLVDLLYPLSYSHPSPWSANMYSLSHLSLNCLPSSSIFLFLDVLGLFVYLLHHLLENRFSQTLIWKHCNLAADGSLFTGHTCWWTNMHGICSLWTLYIVKQCRLLF